MEGSERSSLERLLRERGADASYTLPLAEYGELVLAANRRVNVTGAKTPEALAAQILDSLTLLPYVASPLVDVGSGAGLPAIPLAIAAGIEITMIEATGKKARFLETAVAALDIRGTIVDERAEDAARREDLRERFVSGTGRAVASATTTAELVVPFLRLGGVAALQRGTMTASERDALSDAALVLGAELEGMIDVSRGRQIALLSKKRPTPARFPRRAGIPAKRPICDGS